MECRHRRLRDLPLHPDWAELEVQLLGPNKEVLFEAGSVALADFGPSFLAQLDLDDDEFNEMLKPVEAVKVKIGEALDDDEHDEDSDVLFEFYVTLPRGPLTKDLLWTIISADIMQHLKAIGLHNWFCKRYCQDGE